jgi:hypothetical protein
MPQMANDTNDPMVEILADCLEAIERGEMSVADCLQRFPQEAGDLAPLLEMVVKLRGMQKTPIRPEFVQQSPGRLLAKLPPGAGGSSVTSGRANRYVYKQAVSSGLFSRPVWVLTAIVVLVIALAGSGVVYASGNALPGGALYPVKIGVEDVRLALSSQDGAAELQVQFVQQRGNELERLIKLNRYDQVQEAIGQYESQVGIAVQAVQHLRADDAVLATSLTTQIEATLSNNVTVLTALLNQVPEVAQPAIERAINASNREKNSLQSGEQAPPGLLKKETSTPQPPVETPQAPPGQQGAENTVEPKGRPTDGPHGKPTEKPPNSQSQSGEQHGHPTPKK